MPPQVPIMPETSARRVLAIGSEPRIVFLNLCLHTSGGLYELVPYFTQRSSSRAVSGQDTLSGVIRREVPSCGAMIVDYDDRHAIELARQAGFAGPIIGIAPRPDEMPGTRMVLTRQALTEDADLLRKSLDKLCQDAGYFPAWQSRYGNI